MGEELYDPNLPEVLADGFRTLKPMYDYFRGLELELAPGGIKIRRGVTAVCNAPSLYLNTINIDGGMILFHRSACFKSKSVFGQHLLRRKSDRVGVTSQKKNSVLAYKTLHDGAEGGI